MLLTLASQFGYELAGRRQIAQCPPGGGDTYQAEWYVEIKLPAPIQKTDEQSAIERTPHPANRVNSSKRTQRLRGVFPVGRHLR